MRVLPQLARQFAPVHAGQADVQDENLGPLLPRHLQRLLGVVGHLAAVAAGLQKHHQGSRGIHVVVDHQNRQTLLA